MEATPKVVKMVGPVAWSVVDDAARGQILRAILRDDGKTLVLDLREGRYEYEVTLKRRDGAEFEGRWSCQDRGFTSTDTVSARLYCSESGNFLFGRWHEDGKAHDWWAVLEDLLRFPDEAEA